MRSKKGFTLIELLVVISIIALLLAILMPALGMVKEKAKSVVCRTSLHQWGLCYQLYSNDYDGKLPSFVGSTVSQTTYMESLRDYYGDVNKMRTCPSSTKVSEENPTGYQPLSFFGATSKAWQVDPSAGWINDEDWGIGSFTENSWIRSATGLSDSWGSLSKMRQPSKVPLIGDGRWNNSWPTDNLPTQADNEIDFCNIRAGAGYYDTSLNTFAMRRHGAGSNFLLADMTAMQFDAEELWALKWHRSFKQTQPEDIDLSWMKNW